MAIVVNPQFLAKPERKYVCFRDVREHRKIKMEKKLAEYDWSTIASVQDLHIAACKLNDSILSLINECFPQIKVRISSRDPPFMSPLVKHLCNLRNKQIKMGINPDLQNQINKSIRNHQIRAARQENKKRKQGSRGWWRTVDRITGRKTCTRPCVFANIIRSIQSCRIKTKACRFKLLKPIKARFFVHLIQ